MSTTAKSTSVKCQDPDALSPDVEEFSGQNAALVAHANAVVQRLNAVCRAVVNFPGGNGNPVGQETLLAMHRDGVSVEITVLTTGAETVLK